MAVGNTPLSVDDFINNSSVKECMARLSAEFKSRPFIVSDVLDDKGCQYANLVQKGGGVLGIALVGYTYILEEMGIRFIRLAGTSAGAINTALMTVIGRKEEAKSIRVLDEICKLNFFNLVDGHPAARWLIKNFITEQDFTAKVKKWITGILLTLALLFAADFVFLGLQHALPGISVVTKAFFIFTGFFLLLLSILIAYIATLLKRLKNSGYGINPGDYFYDWIKQQLLANGVKTVSDLNAKAEAPIPGLHLRVPNDEGLIGLKGDVTFIASELVTQNKIQFPAMCNLFRREEDIDTLQPAGFIRASMSIPVFFESYFINDIPCKENAIKDEWQKLGEKDPPTTARFVDGGILSNFPINLFYNPRVITPRLPSLGIDLDDTKPDNASKHSESWSIGGYFYRMFNTIRFYYDKDFLIKNAFFKKGIGTIHLPDFNWLNFFLTDADKIKMFVLGAQAATDFLIKFNWNDYKNDRNEMRKQLLKEQTPGMPMPSKILTTT
ncbi:patatin-like phospholipase family protein [Segetibacter koreensis]|uniref:patatin-like phospholipase family protein n=1 Tax=Segetibacter koreensis TaxID=398037 RepID=UPI0003636271|nr:patatin-like phospholipase family protein [Segetibacter koreensis]